MTLLDEVIDNFLTALSEFRKAVVPSIGEAASLKTICSRVKAIASLK